MANDPRITTVRDATNLPDVGVKDRLDAKITAIDPGTNDWADITVADILGEKNKHLLGRYARTTPGLFSAGSFNNGQFGVNATTIFINIDGAAPSDIGSSNKLYVSGHQFNITNINTSHAETHEFQGSWEALSSTEADWTTSYIETNFDASALITYEKPATSSAFSSNPELLWAAPGGRVTTVSSSTTYTLNAGKIFSDYDIIFVTYDNHGSGTTVDTVNLCAAFPGSVVIANNKIQFHTLNNWKELLIVNDTQFRINAGVSAAGVKQIWGWGV